MFRLKEKENMGLLSSSIEYAGVCLWRMCVLGLSAKAKYVSNFVRRGPPLLVHWPSSFLFHYRYDAWIYSGQSREPRSSVVKKAEHPSFSDSPTSGDGSGWDLEFRDCGTQNQAKVY